MAIHDIVLRGGRVIDPETGLDAVRDVAISGDRVAEVGIGLPPAHVDVDVSAHVVTAGFIDLHSHTTGIAGLRLRALDGVTTALELEAGITPAKRAYARAAEDGRPVNYGYAASWAMARMAELAGVPLDGTLDTFLANIANPGWQGAASPAQTAAILGRLSADLADGALGIGMLVGYAPGSDPDEYRRVAALAADAGAPTFTHARDLVEIMPTVPIDGAQEIVRAAAETGARMHYCHVNSTSGRHIDRVLALVERAQQQGCRISVEVYPYGSGMTAVGAAFLSPERLGERGLTPADLTYAPTGERVADADRLRALRATDPGGLVIVKQLDEDDPADRDLLLRALLFPDAVVASDATPLTWPGGVSDDQTWPLPDDVLTHPRTAGTFSRALRWLAADCGPAGNAGQLSLTEVLRRCSLRPAQLLEEQVPAMRRKGRVQAGCDADLVVFDPVTITDQATYSASTRPSAGIHHVLVNGIFVVRESAVVTGALPGKPVHATPR